MTAQPRDVEPIPKAPAKRTRYRKGTFGVEKTEQLPRWKVEEICRQYRRDVMWCELQGETIPCRNAGGVAPYRATETHHRRERDNGGYLADEANLLALCLGHHTWVHSNEGRDRALQIGALVERDNPEYFVLGPDDRRET